MARWHCAGTARALPEHCLGIDRELTVPLNATQGQRASVSANERRPGTSQTAPSSALKDVHSCRSLLLSMSYHLDGMSKQRSGKRDRPKYVAVVPVGQCSLRPNPKKGTKSEVRVRLAYRLLFTLDDALRTLMKRRGELSMYVLDALKCGDFQKMPLVDINMEIKAPEVNMFMPTELYQKIRAAADRRDVSLNVIVNSAMAQWLAKRGLVEIRPL